jgi:hypothetical protein
VGEIAGSNPVVPTIFSKSMAFGLAGALFRKRKTSRKLGQFETAEFNCVNTLGKLSENAAHTFDK